MNVAGFIKVGGVEKLLSMIEPVLHLMNSEIPVFLGFLNEEFSMDELSHTLYFQFFDRLILLLNYVAVLSSEMDFLVLEKFMDFLGTVEKGKSNFVTEMLANSVLSLIQVK